MAVKCRAPMLLMGPTGAGKCEIAANVFELKKQRQGLAGRFVEVDRATLRGGDEEIARLRRLWTGRRGTNHKARSTSSPCSARTAQNNWTASTACNWPKWCASAAPRSP